MAIDERKLARERERATIEDELVVGGQRRGLGRLDAAHEEERVLDARERREALAPGRQEDAPPRAGQERGGGVQRGGRAPVDLGIALERGALEAQQRDPGLGAGLRRRPRHPLGERVRRVDDRVDALGAQVGGEAGGAAEPADPDLAGWQARARDAAGERRDDAHLGRPAQRRRERARLAGAAEDEHRPHRLRRSP